MIKSWHTYTHARAQNGAQTIDDVSATNLIVHPFPPCPPSSFAQLLSLIPLSLARSDVKDIFKRLYGDRVAITDWSLNIRGNTLVDGTQFGFEPANKIRKDMGPHPVVTWHTWYALDDEMVSQFVWIHGGEMEKYDGFIVTHSPVFCRLFEGFGKPVFMVNSCRYDAPYCWSGDMQQLSKLNACLSRMKKSGQLVAISNNLADQEYLRLGAGVHSIHIPSLCMYTGVTFDLGKNKDEPTVILRKSCNIPQEHLEIFAATPGIRLPDVPTGLFSTPRDAIEEKPFVRLPISDAADVRRRDKWMSWEAMWTGRQMVHFFYEVSTMSIFEQYSAGVPLLVPSQRFCTELIASGQMKLQSRYWRLYYTVPCQYTCLPYQWGYPDPAIVELTKKFEYSVHPLAITTRSKDSAQAKRFCVDVMFFFENRNRKIPEALSESDADETYAEWWASRADVYDAEWMPGVRFFDSWEELAKKAVLQPDAEEMQLHRIQLDLRRERILNMWRQLIEDKFPILASSLAT